MAILFGCYGNTKLKDFFLMTTSKTTEAEGFLFGKNVALHRTIQNSQKFGSLPLGLVAMATESSHRLIMGKWLNCTFSITSDLSHIWQL